MDEAGQRRQIQRTVIHSLRGEARPHARSTRLALSLLPVVLFSLSLIPAVSPAVGASKVPAPAQAVYAEIEVLSLGTSSVTARFTTTAEYNSNITAVTILSTSPNGTQNAFQAISVVFDHWDETAGMLSASKLQRVLVQNVSSAFPFEEVDLQLWVGSNLTIAPPVVSASLPTYTISTTVVSVKLSQLTPAEAEIPAVTGLFASYGHVAEINVRVYHTTYFQFFAAISTMMPVLVMALAVVVVYLSIFRWPKSESNTDYVSALVGLFLFLPIFSFSIDQLIPTAQRDFVVAWLGLVAALTAASFLVVLASLVIVIWKRG